MAQPKRITQETFDGVVRENIDDFEMDLDEAVTDAKEQFASQGVDLSNLITTYVREEGSEGSAGLKHCNPIKDALDEIQTCSDNHGDREKLGQAFTKFRQECSTEGNRKFAASQRAGTILLNACKNIKSNDELLLKGMEAFSSFINGQGDVADKEVINFLYQCLKENSKNENILVRNLKCIRYCCIKRESNRQTYVQLGMIPLLIEILQTHKQTPVVVKESCTVLRVLTFDDDMSVAFGKAHEHAKQIVGDNAISVIMDVMEVYGENVDVVSELCATLGRLFVRDEYCKEFVDVGGLTVMLRILADKIEHQAVVKQVCAVLRALAGNDDVKAAVVQTNGMVLIIAGMTKHAKQAYVAEQGCAALAAIALRTPANCTAIIAAGGHEVILKAMQIHSDVVGVQKQGCLALRNLVARNPDNCEPILGAGGETLIRFAYRRYGAECADLAKAALRDLGCEVELRELWTGKGTANMAR